MADPRAIVPYHDPYDGPFSDDILNFMHDSNPTLADLAAMEGPSSCSHPTPQFNNSAIADASDPLRDPVLWDLCNKSNAAGNSNSQEGPSETNKRMGMNVETGTSSDENMRPLSIWPVSPVPFNCSYCQVLREIIHTNGAYTKKLEVHGRIGTICHAILDNLQNINVNSSSNQNQMFDFCKKSIEDVKQFLIHYCVEQKLRGYVMVQDPLAIFYEALCVGLDWDEDVSDDLFQPSPRSAEGARQMDEPEAEHEHENERTAVPRLSLAAQRERAGKLTLKDVSSYFHLPIEEAARRMKLCPTVLKKICRRDGMNRWPHRKVKSIQKQISSLRNSLNSSGVEARENAQAEIDRLQRELTNVCAGVSI